MNSPSALEISKQNSYLLLKLCIKCLFQYYRKIVYSKPWAHLPDLYRNMVLGKAMNKTYYFFENIIIFIILCLLNQTRYEPFWWLFPFKIELPDLITQLTSSHFMKSTMQYHDWLIVHCLSSRWRVFHSYRDVTIASEGLQNLGFSRSLQYLNMKESSSCHACYDTGPHPTNRAPFSRLFRQTNGTEDLV